MAMNQSISLFTSKSNYLFFETLRGYHFRSLQSLYAQPSSQTYTTFVAGSSVDNGGITNVEKELANVIDFEIIENPNSIVNYTGGTFASNLIVHDIFSKTYKKYKYGIFDEFRKESIANEGNDPAEIELSMRYDYAILQF